jgi:hypothetical protein
LKNITVSSLGLAHDDMRNADGGSKALSDICLPSGSSDRITQKSGSPAAAAFDPSCYC